MTVGGKSSGVSHLNCPSTAVHVAVVQVQWCQEVRQLQPQHPLHNVNIAIHHFSDAVLNLQEAKQGGVCQQKRCGERPAVYCVSAMC